MVDPLIEIHIQKAVLFLRESELRLLPADVLAEGLRRGKRILRRRRMDERMGRIHQEHAERVLLGVGTTEAGGAFQS